MSISGQRLAKGIVKYKATNLAIEGAEVFVLDTEIIDQDGVAYDHFLVTNAGWRWEVIALAVDESGVFDYVGCGNW